MAVAFGSQGKNWTAALGVGLGFAAVAASTTIIYAARSHATADAAHVSAQEQASAFKAEQSDLERRLASQEADAQAARAKIESLTAQLDFYEVRRLSVFHAIS